MYTSRETAAHRYVVHDGITVIIKVAEFKLFYKLDLLERM